MAFDITNLHDIKKAFQVELKKERALAKSLNTCSSCNNSGYKEMNINCDKCFVGDLVGAWMYWTNEYHKSIYG